ncbi:hypothetical protein GEMRC1_011198 [Eukaryota sp. GEM-RC1]
MSKSIFLRIQFLKFCQNSEHLHFDDFASYFIDLFPEHSQHFDLSFISSLCDRNEFDLADFYNALNTEIFQFLLNMPSLGLDFWRFFVSDLRYCIISEFLKFVGRHCGDADDVIKNSSTHAFKLLSDSNFSEKLNTVLVNIEISIAVLNYFIKMDDSHNVRVFVNSLLGLLFSSPKTKWICSPLEIKNDLMQLIDWDQADTVKEWVLYKNNSRLYATFSTGIVRICKRVCK